MKRRPEAPPELRRRVHRRARRRVAEILQVSATTVYRRVQAGELPYIKPCAEQSRSIGHRHVRIKPEDLAAYIDAHRVASEPAESEPADNTAEEK